ncbi:MAG: hypothetical protein NVSMB52_03100 [Chloroflexota bacterium]
MSFRAVCVATIALVLLTPQLVAARHGAASMQRTGLILHDNVTVRSRPSAHGHTIAVLMQQSQVRIIGARRAWDHVLMWASVKGWVPKKEVVFGSPWATVSTYRAPEVHYHVQAHAARALSAEAEIIKSVQIKNSAGAVVLRPGTHAHISQWRQDASGNVWYRISNSWVGEEAVKFVAINPDRWTPGHRPGWAVVAGKGMWLTLGIITGATPGAIVKAAQRNGITHLYLEAAISPLGFHGKRTVGHLVDAAHRGHIAIIAWVYPYLYDLAADVLLTSEVAAFKTPAGNAFDGIAADLERNVNVLNVRTYSQLVRAYVGKHYLLIGVTYPPQSLPNFPFAEVARQYDVLAPMDYWHQTKTAYGLDYGHLPYGREYGFRYAANSIAAIRAAGASMPIEPIGQAFDDFGRLEMGPHAPSGDELKGFFTGCKRGGAIGASFFQWMTVTPDDWQALHDFRY